MKALIQPCPQTTMHAGEHAMDPKNQLLTRTKYRTKQTNSLTEVHPSEEFSCVAGQPTPLPPTQKNHDFGWDGKKSGENRSQTECKPR